MKRPLGACVRELARDQVERVFERAREVDGVAGGARVGLGKLWEPLQAFESGQHRGRPGLEQEEVLSVSEVGCRRIRQDSNVLLSLGVEEENKFARLE